MDFLDRLLNRYSMTFFMKSYLAALVGLALVLSLAGVLPFDFWNLLAMNLYLTGLCVASNLLFARLFKADASIDSPLITGQILTLIFGPVQFTSSLPILTFIAVVAMASKYLVAWRKKHIFNPAAIAVAASAILFDLGATWWVAHPWLLPAVVAGGIIMTAKIRRWHLVAAFLGAYLALSAVIFFLAGGNAALLISKLLIASPLLFFTFVMLVEPLTSPARRQERIYYGIFTAVVLVVLQRGTGYTFSLELALLAGNLFAFSFGAAKRYSFELIAKEEVAKDTWRFKFKKPARFNFEAGQYMEWTLPHKKADNRGIRRWFTISSSPGEEHVAITMRFSPKSSTFKQALLEIAAGQHVTATGPEGDFILPADPKKPLIWIAGGIGITPFRAQMKWLIQNQQKRPITLFYANPTAEHIAYKDLFDQAQQQGYVKVIYSLDEPAGGDWYQAGRIDAEMIKRYAELNGAIIFISGPEPMVKALTKQVKKAGARDQQIRTDYFPGY